MTSQAGKQTIALHILHNNSRSEGNQTMKYDQLIDYNIRNIFLEKSFTKCGGETDPFLKNQNWVYISWSTVHGTNVSLICNESSHYEKCELLW